MTERLITPEAFDADFEDVSLLQDDVDRQIDAVIAEFGDEEVNATKLKVYKTIPNMGKMEWLFDCTPNELPIMERLRDEFGGGKYEARLYSGTPLKLKKKFEILIGEPKKQPIIKQDNNREIVTVMMEGFNKLGELIAAQQQPQNNIGELLQNMIAMKEFIGSNQTPTESPFKMMSQVIELQKSLVPPDSGTGAGTGDLLLNMANTILPKLAEMGEQEQKLKTLALRRRMINGKKRPQKRSQQIEGDNPMKMHLIFLTAQAKLNNDPMTYAHMVIDNTPAEKMQELKDFIAGDNAINNMTAIHKAVGNHPIWFRNLGECIIELLRNDPTLTNPPTSTINPIESTIPGATGSQTIAPNQDDENADQNAIISDS